MSVLEVHGLVKRFGTVSAIDGVHLTIADGAVTAIVGPSGCGKTTLLRVVAGFLAADAGEVSLAGRLVHGPRTHVPTQRRNVGYVPQEGALFPHLDVAANITFGLDRRRRRSADVGDLLELLELDPDLARRHPHELSGGQQQRVAVARALAREPHLLLLDEPFSSLDASLRESTGRAVVRAVQARGAAALLVTHDQNEALSLADSVAVMQSGRLVQVGAPMDVYTHPATPFVATFVGSGTVLPARVEAGVAYSAIGALPTPGHADTERVDIFVRPEQVELLDESETRGRVVGFDFHGHDATVHLAVDGHPDVLCRVRGDALPEVGANVGIAAHGSVTVFGSSVAEAVLQP